ncbi:ATPase, histidine kinase-, DNA gyrase B-, and HSP90-like domain protein [Verrucomicrobiia bacterium DG1235]|nr:ATPase, histidine kinase-, DNA gyrase B-, and HSP90-like domain protein [Verrucomicrobiae bacterium DG1235]
MRIVIALCVLTGLGILASHSYLSTLANETFRANIEEEARATDEARKMRQLVLTEICESLARKPRIRAALEDDALDLLYLSAKDELSIIYKPRSTLPGAHLHALFYRFLDADGRLIKPIASSLAGEVPTDAEEILASSEASNSPDLRYLQTSLETSSNGVIELYTIPIHSSEAVNPISSLVVGFPLLTPPTSNSRNLYHCLSLNGSLVYSSLPAQYSKQLETSLSKQLHSTQIHALEIEDHAYRLASRRLPGSNEKIELWEYTLASTQELESEQSKATVDILSSAALLLLFGFGLSHWAAQRISRPVEEMARAGASEEASRVQAEYQLDKTSKELKRAARFSADASHQLKTPVTVLKAGLQSLLEDDSLSPANRSETHDMIRQTGRLSAVIDDLLLLSRLDAGQLSLKLTPTKLRLMLEELVDDLSILPAAASLDIKIDLSPDLEILGERGYTILILQNLIENAQKYNRPNGRILISATTTKDRVSLTIGNTGKSIPPDAQAHIFERFHRGSAGENVQGYGLGLNLAHELALLHGGQLSLLVSKHDWTDFQLDLQLATPQPAD